MKISVTQGARALSVQGATLARLCDRRATTMVRESSGRTSCAAMGIRAARRTERSIRGDARIHRRERRRVQLPQEHGYLVLDFLTADLSQGPAASAQGRPHGRWPHWGGGAGM